tara:strand:+ start:698 stop:1000 length:303 start_codon:yes stop_codon:yes gene_type:complete
MSENIAFSVSGSETYYHKDWLKTKGFKWIPSGKKWEKLNILEIEADQLSEYCREFGLYYERSDKGMPKFDYENYLWDGNIPDKNSWYEDKSLPKSSSKKN